MAKRELATVLKDYKNAVAYWRKLAGKLAMENQELRTRCEWRQAKTAPKDGTEILCLERNGAPEGRAFVVSTFKGEDTFYTGDMQPIEVEWWLPIPHDPDLKPITPNAALRSDH